MRSSADVCVEVSGVVAVARTSRVDLELLSLRMRVSSSILGKNSSVRLRLHLSRLNYSGAEHGQEENSSYEGCIGSALLCAGNVSRSTRTSEECRCRTAVRSSGVRGTR